MPRISLRRRRLATEQAPEDLDEVSRLRLPVLRPSARTIAMPPLIRPLSPTPSVPSLTFSSSATSTVANEQEDERYLGSNTVLAESTTIGPPYDIRGFQSIVEKRLRTVRLAHGLCEDAYVAEAVRPKDDFERLFDAVAWDLDVCEYDELEAPTKLQEVPRPPKRCAFCLSTEAHTPQCCALVRAYQRSEYESPFRTFVPDELLQDYDVLVKGVSGDKR